jgi:hypothetical protein
LMAIDPGPVQSGWVVFDGDGVQASGTTPNHGVLFAVKAWEADLAIEMIASYGMPVGAEVFETCVWIGRFMQASRHPETVRRVTRLQVKQHLCHDSRAKDPNIRQALIDRLGAPGRKREPGPTFGVSGDAWAALGVAVTAWDKMTLDTASYTGLQ